MSKYSASAPKRTSGGVSSAGRSSGSSSGRVAANSYGDGTKYAGGNTFVDSSGNKTQVSGDYTSPSGKTSHIDNDGNITTINSKDSSQNGTTYYNNGNGTYTYSGKYGGDTSNMQVEALREAMDSNKDALEAAYRASAKDLDAAILKGKREAYVNNQKAENRLPQLMAAQGNNGGVSETTGANLEAVYQNALTDLNNTKASELARLQADKANGIANVDTTYNTQIANALQAAEQMAYQREQDAAQLALAQRAAALEEQKYADSLNRDSGSKYSASDITKLIDAGVITAQDGARLLGLSGYPAAVSVPGDTAEKLNRWYSALGENEFTNRVAQDIKLGKLDESVYKSWLASRGLI